MIIFQKMITREDLRKNKDVYYVFGDNAERVGYGGQAKEMRGEKNAIGVRTKWRPYSTGLDNDEYFSDSQFDLIKPMLDEDFLNIETALAAGSICVFPLDGLGTGRAKLPQRAPKTYRYIQKKIKDLEKYLQDD